MNTNASNTTRSELDVVVVGAGCGGLYALRRMREAGYLAMATPFDNRATDLAELRAALAAEREARGL